MWLGVMCMININDETRNIYCYGPCAAIIGVEITPRSPEVQTLKIKYYFFHFGRYSY